MCFLQIGRTDEIVPVEGEIVFDKTFSRSIEELKTIQN
jgi:hypothetical protein